VLHGTSYAILCPPVPASNSPVPSRSRQSGSRYRPAPVHLCPDPVPVPQTELTPSLINFTTPTADWCPRSGGGWLFNETQACLVTVLSSVWDGESGKWQSVNNGKTIDTSVCSLSIPHVARTRRWGGRSRDKP